MNYGLRENTKNTVIAVRRDWKAGMSVYELMQKYSYSKITIRFMLLGYSNYQEVDKYESPLKSLRRSKK